MTIKPLPFIGRRLLIAKHFLTELWFQTWRFCYSLKTPSKNAARSQLIKLMHRHNQKLCISLFLQCKLFGKYRITLPLFVMLNLWHCTFLALLQKHCNALPLPVYIKHYPKPDWHKSKNQHYLMMVSRTKKEPILLPGKAGIYQ